MEYKCSPGRFMSMCDGGEREREREEGGGERMSKN